MLPRVGSVLRDLYRLWVGGGGGVGGRKQVVKVLLRGWNALPSAACASSPLNSAHSSVSSLSSVEPTVASTVLSRGHSLLPLQGSLTFPTYHFPMCHLKQGHQYHLAAPCLLSRALPPCIHPARQVLWYRIGSAGSASRRPRT